MWNKAEKFLILSILLFVSIFLSAMTASAQYCSSLNEDYGECVMLGDSGYNLCLVKPFPEQVPNSVADYTIFHYCLDPIGTSKNVSLIDVLIPKCSEENTIKVSAYDPNGWAVYGNDYTDEFTGITEGIPGEGSPSTDFGTGVVQYYVFEQAFNSDGEFELYTTKAVAAPTSIGLKIGAKLYSVLVPGPDCYPLDPPPPTVAVTVENFMLDGDIPLVVMRNALTGKVETVTFDEEEIFGRPLSDYPLYTCVENQDTKICENDLPITHMPDGITKTGENSCWIATFNNIAYVFCTP